MTQKIFYKLDNPKLLETLKEIDQKQFSNKKFVIFSKLRKKYPIRNRSKLKELKSLYIKVSNQMDHQFHLDRTITNSENYFYKYLNQSVRLKIIQSVWIGPHCIDIFIPSAKYGIELYGDIHNREFKMRKDTSRDAHLQKLDLFVTTIDNDEADKYMFSIQKSLFNRPKYPQYQIDRMWRDIYLFTILSHDPSKLDQIEVTQ